MSTFSSTLEIDRPPEVVFGYATDPTRFPEWQPDVVSVEWEGAGGLVGSRFTTKRRVPGGMQSYVQEVSENKPFRSWVVKGIEGTLRPNASVVVEPIHEGQHSRVTFTLSYGSSRAGRLLVPLVERSTPKQANRSYQLLKEILESRR
ncbi:MAG TPA: SRPBCC family protein [Candidatus Limnocylindrales bacterium]